MISTGEPTHVQHKIKSAFMEINFKKSNRTQKLKWFGCTDCGKFRPNNEDAFLGLQFDATEVNHLGKIGEATILITALVSRPVSGGHKKIGEATILIIISASQ